MQSTPDQILDTEDPGADVALRYKYQHCYAAIHALKTVLPVASVEEVICENHEDFLVRFSDGTLVAVQIKTRERSQPLFKGKDDEVIKALARFARLEMQYPGAFKCYEFLTNHLFWDENETDNSLLYLLSFLQKRGSVKGLKKDHPLRAWVAKICAESGLEKEQVTAALLKCRCTARNDTVDAGSKDVLEAVAECPGLGSLPFHKVRELSTALIGLAREASTKSNGTSVLALYTAGSDFAALLAHQQLQAKRITKSQVEQLIAEHTAITIEALSDDDAPTFDDLPKTLSAMYQKLERGQLEADRVHELENLVRSVEALYIRWAVQYGADQANKRINDLKELVQFDCTEAKVAAAKKGHPYGSAMYEELYKILRARCALNAEHVYKCRPEHLMGAAGILTEECTVWWSEQFEVATEGSV